MEEKIAEINEQLLAMNPAQRNTQLPAISRLLDGSGHVVTIKLPKKAPQGRGRPKGASNKPKPTSTTTKKPKSTSSIAPKPKSTASTTNKPKSTNRDPSAFEYVEKKTKRDLFIAAAKKRKQEREEKLKKKEKEEALKKDKESATPTQTRPIRKAAAKSIQTSAPPKKKIRAIQIASRLPIKPPTPQLEDESPEVAPPPARPGALPLRKAWEDSSYITAIPGILQDYVKTTLNVESDGHCGF